LKNLIMAGSLVLALLAALGYLLMGMDVISPGDTGTGGGPPGFAWIMLIGYATGGILVFFQKRWLWITGAWINGIVVAGFIIMYITRLSVMFSAPGLMTKIPQILLEAGLIYLIRMSRPVKAMATA
jgi:hypothetical protein